MSKPIKKCQICHKESEQNFYIAVLEPYELKNLPITLEAITPHAPKELQPEITSFRQELKALDEKIKPIRKEWVFLLEDFYQKKLNISFTKSLISYIEKGDESTDLTICQLCGQELEQQEKLINKKLEEIWKDAEELMNNSERVGKEIEKKIGQEKFNQIIFSSESKKKWNQEILAELKSFLEKPSESTQQDSKPQSNQPKPTNYTPWIIGGIAGVGAIAGITIWLVIKKRKNAN